MRELVTFTRTKDEFDNHVLRIALQERADVEEIAANQDKGTIEKFTEIIEWQLSNGWTLVPPEKIGALTDSLLLSEDYREDADETIENVGHIYWYPLYETHDEIAELLKNGYVDFDLSI